MFAQKITERKLSFQTYGGISLFSRNEKRNAADQPTRIFAAYKPAPTFGAGVYYRLANRLYLGEHATILIAKKSNHRLSALAFRTSMRYNLINQNKFKLYALAGINHALTTLRRDENVRTITPEPDAAGPGFTTTRITYREEFLKIKRMPMLGVSAGVGAAFKIHKKIDLYAEYTYNGLLAKNNKELKVEFVQNSSNFSFHTICMGIHFKLLKQKQLLASLKIEQWRSTGPVDIKGVIIYKNPKKPLGKPFDVEFTDTSEVIIQNLPTNEKGVIFYAKNIEPGNYQFMLPKPNRKIIKADIQILNYNKINIEEEDLDLVYIDEDESENIISRDANFSVLLREGFQHEVDLMTSAQNIMGRLNSTDPNCRIRIILKDMYDTVVSVIDTLSDDNTFNFVNIAPGNYKVVFQPMTRDCKNTNFNYTFTGATPFIKSQFNTNIPEDSYTEYNIYGKISTENSTKVPKGTATKLINPDGKVVTSTSLGGDGQFKYEHLESPNYTVAYIDPADKSKLEYDVKDKKDKIIKQYRHTFLPNKEKNTPQDTSIRRDVSVNGKVVLTNPSAKATVLLIDSVGKIRKQIPLNPDGTFEFKNLTKNKYRVAFETSDPKVNGKLTYYVNDPSSKPIRIKAKELYALIEKTDTIHQLSKQHHHYVQHHSTPQALKDKNKPKANLATKAVPKDTAVIIGVTKFEFSNFKSNQTYNQDRVIVQPTGYGVQINAFIDTINLKKHFAQLKREGKKEFYVQVVNKFDDNQIMIYRILLGQYPTIEKAQEAAIQLKQEGYETTVRKHLDPTKSP